MFALSIRLKHGNISAILNGMELWRDLYMRLLFEKCAFIYNPAVNMVVDVEKNTKSNTFHFNLHHNDTKAFNVWSAKWTIFQCIICFQREFLFIRLQWIHYALVHILLHSTVCSLTSISWHIRLIGDDFYLFP